jgi:uncharacterized protein YkwD
MTSLARHLAPALLACVALTVPAAASAAAPCADAGLVPSGANVAKAKTATLCLLNVERKSHRLAPLSANAQLGKSAQSFSANMVRQHFFDHVSPGGSTLSSRVRGSTTYLRGNIRAWSLGENIAWGSSDLATPREIVRSWMHSAGHRHNILQRSFRHIGLGIAIGAPEDVGTEPAATYTTDFGSRVLR